MFDKMKSLNCIENRIHKESCNCDHYRFEMELDESIQDEHVDIANQNRFQEIDTETNDEKTKLKFVESYNTLKHKFHDLYKEVFPSVKEYASFENIIKKTIYILIYRSSHSEDLNYEFLSEDNLHKYCEENKSKITESILIENKGMLWFIMGTGCVCCDFSPINPANLDKNLISRLVLQDSIVFKKKISH